jgi:hypothetical protein
MGKGEHRWDERNLTKVTTMVVEKIPDYLRDLVAKDKLTPREARGTIYRALFRAANRGLPCPTGWVLAELCGYGSANGTVAPMKQLERLNMIEVQRFNRSRRVKIIATGKWTRGHANQRPHWRDSARATSRVGEEG